MSWFNVYGYNWVEMLEQIGRFGCMAISSPILCRGFGFSEIKNIYIVLSIVLVVLYCLGWRVF